MTSEAKWDEEEDMLWVSSDARISVYRGPTQEAQMAFMWSPSDPMVARIRMSMPAPTTDITPDLFPNGIPCGKCGESIKDGAQAHTVSVNHKDDSVFCRQCAIDHGDDPDYYLTDWEVGYAVLREGYTTRLGESKPEPGVLFGVRRVNRDKLIMEFRDYDGGVAQAITPAWPLETLFRAIDSTFEKMKRSYEDLENAHLDVVMKTLENMANQE